MKKIRFQTKDDVIAKPDGNVRNLTEPIESKIWKKAMDEAIEKPVAAGPV